MTTIPASRLGGVFERPVEAASNARPLTQRAGCEPEIRQGAACTTTEGCRHPRAHVIPACVAGRIRGGCRTAPCAVQWTLVAKMETTGRGRPFRLEGHLNAPCLGKFETTELPLTRRLTGLKLRGPCQLPASGSAGSSLAGAGEQPMRHAGAEPRASETAEISRPLRAGARLSAAKAAWQRTAPLSSAWSARPQDEFSGGGMAFCLFARARVRTAAQESWQAERLRPARAERHWSGRVSPRRGGPGAGEGNAATDAHPSAMKPAGSELLLQGQCQTTPGSSPEKGRWRGREREAGKKDRQGGRYRATTTGASRLRNLRARRVH